MADLYVDSTALRGFTDQLNRLTSDFSTAIYNSGAPSPLDDELQGLTGADKTCGDRLNNFLTSLARYTDAAATSAEQLDTDLAQSTHLTDVAAPHHTVGLHEQALAE